MTARHALVGVSHVIDWDDPVITEDGEELAQWVTDVQRHYGVTVELGDQNRPDGCEVLVVGNARHVEAYRVDVDAATYLPADHPFLTAVAQ